METEEVVNRRTVIVVALSLLALGLAACVPPPPPPDPVSGCLDSSDPGVPDVSIVGPVTSFGSFAPLETPPTFYKNTRGWASTDGSCTNPATPEGVFLEQLYPHFTTVSAPDAASALTMCNYGGSTGPSTNNAPSASPLVAAGYDVPADAHVCSHASYDTLRPGTCYDRPSFDVRFDGPRNAVGNLAGFQSSDGTCTPPVAGPPATVVQAVNPFAATALCASITGGPATSIVTDGLPPDTFVCLPPD